MEKTADFLVVLIILILILTYMYSIIDDVLVTT